MDKDNKVIRREDLVVKPPKTHTLRLTNVPSSSNVQEVHLGSDRRRATITEDVEDNQEPRGHLLIPMDHQMDSHNSETVNEALSSNSRINLMLPTRISPHPHPTMAHLDKDQMVRLLLPHMARPAKAEILVVLLPEPTIPLDRHRMVEIRMDKHSMLLPPPLHMVHLDRQAHRVTITLPVKAQMEINSRLETIMRLVRISLVVLPLLLPMEHQTPAVSVALQLETTMLPTTARTHRILET